MTERPAQLLAGGQVLLSRDGARMCRAALVLAHRNAGRRNGGVQPSDELAWLSEVLRIAATAEGTRPAARTVTLGAGGDNHVEIVLVTNGMLAGVIRSAASGQPIPDASVLTVDQMPIMGDATRVAVHEFPGGHMFYTRDSSRADLRKDVMDMYAKH